MADYGALAVYADPDPISITDQEILEDNWKVICDNLDVEDVIPHLKREQVLGERDLRILEEMPAEAPDHLLRVLIKGNAGAYSEFVTALKRSKKNQTLLQVLGVADYDEGDDLDPVDREKVYAQHMKTKDKEIAALKHELETEKRRTRKWKHRHDNMVTSGISKDREISRLRQELMAVDRQLFEARRVVQQYETGRGGPVHGSTLPKNKTTTQTRTRQPGPLRHTHKK